MLLMLKETFITYDVWVQGIDNHRGFIGSMRGYSFRNACKKLLGSDENFLFKQMTYCGLRLFDNQY